MLFGGFHLREKGVFYDTRLQILVELFCELCCADKILPPDFWTLCTQRHCCIGNVVHKHDLKSILFGNGALYRELLTINFFFHIKKLWSIENKKTIGFQMYNGSNAAASLKSILYDLYTDLLTYTVFTLKKFRY